MPKFAEIMVSATINSPIENLDFPLFTEKGITVDLKRDDLIHPFISGNKWRKLKYPLYEAQRQGKTRLVSFGGAWSNHLLALACAGAKFGFGTLAFVRGEEVSNPNLSLCRLFGMELRFVSRSAYRDKAALFAGYASRDERAFFVDEGGFGPDGAKGCEELVDELEETYDHIFCACGTGTTLAGLHNGIARKGWATQLHGVPVLAGGDFIRDSMETLTHGTTSGRVMLHTGYHFGGYAKTGPALNTFIGHFCKRTGILIEPVYTGKLCYAVFDLAERGHFSFGDRILIIHTGGLIGILGMHGQIMGKI